MVAGFHVRRDALAAVALTSVLGCTMLNPAFDEKHNPTIGASENGSGTETPAEAGSQDVGDGDPGDGEPGDGDGDPGDGDGDPGDGDGDPGDGDPGDGDGDPCADVPAGFLRACTAGNDLCPQDYTCVLLYGGGPVEDSTPGVCTTYCQQDSECAWGAQGECVDEALHCVDVLSGGQLISACGIYCDVDMDCRVGQVCHLASGLCRFP